jgi:hypothetical protein
MCRRTGLAPDVDEDGLPARLGMDSLYAHMFVDDVANMVFPIGGYVKERNNPAVRLLVADSVQTKETEQLVTAGLSYGESYSRADLSRAVCDWGRYCSSQLLRNGKAWYELAFLVEGDSVPVGFRLLPIRSGRVAKRFLLFGRYVQEIPAGARVVRSDTGDEEELARRELAEIEPERLIHVQMPRNLRHARIAALRLADIGDTIFPDFVGQGFDLPASVKVPFEFDVYSRTRDAALAQATSSTGWNARGTFNEYQTEYYAIARRMKFERVLYDFRKLVIQSLNDVLIRAGGQIGFSAHIEPAGLPTLETIAGTEASLAAGDTSARDLLKKCRLF